MRPVVDNCEGRIRRTEEHKRSEEIQITLLVDPVGIRFNY